MEHNVVRNEIPGWLGMKHHMVRNEHHMFRNEHYMVRNETTHGQEWNRMWSGMKHHMIRNETSHGQE
jgi:hypothetical protein